MADVNENIGLKLLFQSWFSIYLVLHRSYRWIINLTKYMIASLLSLTVCIILNLNYIYVAWIFSVHCIKEVDWKLTLNRNFNPMCSVTSSISSSHCTATSNVLTVAVENHKWFIFPILPVNVLQSYCNVTNRLKLKYL